MRRQGQIVSRFNKRINKEANTGIKEENLPDKYKAVEKMEIEEPSFRKKRNIKPEQYN
jgi:hypothetical protein